ncbi:MAG: phosphate ABC transporter permease PstA [Armatimonadota bacterium]|nr:phosphate ABC transporter permease PstA [Armatimonadota bacterium]MDR7500398.1 phosphate ABC transporter permease PstA [Armatimonadota bacterium]MDR7548038.1 phosphate ABC transporter permease PstA [Armatimonadota bacterium]
MKAFWRSGDPYIWLTGGALGAALLMVAGLMGLVLVNGLGFFWPRAITQLELTDGTVLLGEIVERERVPQAGPAAFRIKVKQGNRDLTGADFLWVDEAKIVRRSRPPEAVVVERREWGNLYGTVAEVRDGNQVVATDARRGLAEIRRRLPAALALAAEIRRIEREEIGRINYEQEQIRLRLRRLELQGVTGGPQVDALRQRLAQWQTRYDERAAKLAVLRQRQGAIVVFALAGGRRAEVSLFQILRVTAPNEMSLLAKVGLYAHKVWEFVSTDPRESNTEGGVFPAIFGTVMMVMIMSAVVTPLGVLAAFFLREYASQGPFTSAVRIAVNNLAGVPSIVFGVFGVGFFIYFVGGGIDRLFFPEALPTPTFGTGGILWASLTLALLTVPVVIVATEEGLAAIPREMREASLALGATKFETTTRVVLPAVTPSILTGLILAMARAAGEVAPLMITGVVKLAPSLPVDGYPPFLHLERKFMHLGFHIYDVGFQSPNVDAARPMVFATTLLLLIIVLLLNLFAITLRNRLRRRFSASGVL